jgi:hypothetical protein
MFSRFGQVPLLRAVLRDHRVAAIAAGASRQAREQMLHPATLAEREAFSDGVVFARRLLACLHPIPEILIYDPELRNVLHNHSSRGLSRDTRLPVSGSLTNRCRFQTIQPT